MISMKSLKKIGLLVVVCTLIVAALSVVTSAKTYTGTKYGYKSDYIYVHTTKANATIPLTIAKGTVRTSENADRYDCAGSTSVPMYASYEVKISRWNGSSYVLESNYDIYCKSTHTINLKKANSDYKIQIYQWKVKTTLDSYINKGKIAFSDTMYLRESPYWYKLPKYSTGTLKNCSMYSKNPH